MSRRAWLTSITVAVVIAAIIAAVIILKPWSAPAEPAAAPPAATQTAAPVGVSEPTLNDLAARLTSDDPEVLAAALGLEPSLVPPEVQAGFPTLQIVFDSAAAQPTAENIWVVPATVTNPDGTTSAWSITLLDTPDGLVFVDSAEGVAP